MSIRCRLNLVLDPKSILSDLFSPNCSVNYSCKHDKLIENVVRISNIIYVIHLVFDRLAILSEH